MPTKRPLRLQELVQFFHRYACMWVCICVYRQGLRCFLRVLINELIQNHSKVWLVFHFGTWWSSLRGKLLFLGCSILRLRASCWEKWEKWEQLLQTLSFNDGYPKTVQTKILILCGNHLFCQYFGLTHTSSEAYRQGTLYCEGCSCCSHDGLSKHYPCILFPTQNEQWVDCPMIIFQSSVHKENVLGHRDLLTPGSSQREVGPYACITWDSRCHRWGNCK